MGAELKIAEALEPIVQARGLEIWDVERSGSSLRVLVDRPGGVDLDALAALSNAISDLLDEREDLAPAGHYELDVSSPGLERRLREPRHFASCVGQEVAIKTSVAVEGSRRFEGLLISATAEMVTIEGSAGDGPLSTVQIPVEAIERAHTVFRWGSPPRAPKTKRAGQRTAATRRELRPEAGTPEVSREAG